MRFPYYQITVKDFAPIIPIKIQGPKGWLEFEAYIDSGASVSIFHADRAEILGIDIQDGDSLYLTVGDGGLLEVYLHKVTVELASEQFSSTIGFSDHLGVGFNLLGRKSIFEHFRICFDDLNRFIELTPISKTVKK
ncbi:hypothetical protein HY008_02790 [Candidatus Woesebacteria bacterium]|nr:hypothetical protein [Candidatus Woesebacteria bacterium]